MIYVHKRSLVAEKLLHAAAPLRPDYQYVSTRGLSFEVTGNNVWMHLQKRMLAHVRGAFALDAAAYAALTKDQRRRRKLELLQVAADVCRNPSVRRQAPAGRHAWVDCNEF